MDNRRVHRISEEMRREVADLVQNKLKDPRIPEFTSISYVEVTRDLSFANIGISVLGNEEEKMDALEGINSAKGFIKKELGKRLKLRQMPELIFHTDDRIEKSMEFQRFLEEVQAEDERRELDR
ncbi:MAG: 30S ribosome-binding factor RbfA [Tissierellia bacterium]|nr:30S ribosome-binding factor RbfA [Tissierellia bacterium]